MTGARQAGAGPANAYTREAADASAADSSVERRALLLLLGITLLGLVLRFWHLGEWNFQATEMFTYRDSQSPQFANARPLGYLLNYFLVRPFHPLDELGLRLIPALAGTLAIPAMYFFGRRLVGSRAALFAALLVTLNPTQILYSQLARYWSLVFLFTIIAPIAVYLGVRERNVRLFALGIVHHDAGRPLPPGGSGGPGGPALLLLSGVSREQLARWWARSRRSRSGHGGRCPGRPGAVPLRSPAPRLDHDARPHAGLRAVPAAAAGPARRQAGDAAPGLTDSLTVPVVLAALAGVYLVWRASREQRQVALFLASVGGIPPGVSAAGLVSAPRCRSITCCPPTPALLHRRRCCSSIGCAGWSGRRAPPGWCRRPWLS